MMIYILINEKTGERIERHRGCLPFRHFLVNRDSYEVGSANNSIQTASGKPKGPTFWLFCQKKAKKLKS